MDLPEFMGNVYLIFHIFTIFCFVYFFHMKNFYQNIKNSLFFAGSFGCSIGFGDHYPITTSGRLFAILYSLAMLPFVGYIFTEYR